MRTQANDQHATELLHHSRPAPSLDSRREFSAKPQSHTTPKRSTSPSKSDTHTELPAIWGGGRARFPLPPAWCTEAQRPLNTACLPYSLVPAPVTWGPCACPLIAPRTPTDSDTWPPRIEAALAIHSRSTPGAAPGTQAPEHQYWLVEVWAQPCSHTGAVSAFHSRSPPAALGPPPR